jgi:hypothetical protein
VFGSVRVSVRVSVCVCVCVAVEGYGILLGNYLLKRLVIILWGITVTQDGFGIYLRCLL